MSVQSIIPCPNCGQPAHSDTESNGKRWIACPECGYSAEDD